MYGSTNQRGFNMIKVKDFFLTLKTNWIKRYVNGINDHWADLMDTELSLTRGIDTTLPNGALNTQK